jgi:hypothetical protein
MKQKEIDGHINRIDTLIAAARSAMIRQVLDGRSGSVTIRAEFSGGGIRKIESQFTGQISEWALGEKT